MEASHNNDTTPIAIRPPQHEEPDGGRTAVPPLDTNKNHDDDPSRRGISDGSSGGRHDGITIVDTNTTTGEERPSSLSKSYNNTRSTSSSDDEEKKYHHLKDDDSNSKQEPSVVEQQQQEREGDEDDGIITAMRGNDSSQSASYSSLFGNALNDSTKRHGTPGGGGVMTGSTTRTTAPMMDGTNDLVSSLLSSTTTTTTTTSNMPASGPQNDNGTARNDEEEGMDTIDFQHELDLIWDRVGKPTTPTTTDNNNNTTNHQTNEKNEWISTSGTGSTSGSGSSTNTLDGSLIITREQAIRQTIELISSMFQDILHDGIIAYQGWQTTQTQLKMILEDRDCKARDIERLRQTELLHRESIANLLRAVETSKTETNNEQIQTNLIHSMRSNLLDLTDQRDRAIQDGQETKRKLTLCQDELNQSKTKFAKLKQEKTILERDQRMTLSLVATTAGQSSSMGGAGGGNGSSMMSRHHASDMDFYKRKVTELNTHLQGMTSVLAEKNRKIDEMRRQIERSMSQNRLASYRAEAEASSASSKTIRKPKKYN